MPVKTTSMKTFAILFLFPLLLADNSVSSETPECEYKADFSSNDIEVKGSLETRVTSKVEIAIENKGSCTWKKNEVYMQVQLYTGPKGFNRSEAFNNFKTRVKHQMNTDNITPGRAAKFIISFNPVEMEGLYRLGFTLIGKGGKTIHGPVTKDLKYSD